MRKKILFIGMLCAVTVYATVFAGSADEQRLYLTAQKILDDWRGDEFSLSEAKKILQEIMDHNPDSAFAYVGLGRLTYKKGYINNDHYDKEALEKARHYLDKALEIDPQMFDAYFYSAYVRIFSDNLQEASQLAEKARELDHESPKAGLLLAEIAVRQKQFREAEKWAKFAISKTFDKKVLIDSHRLLAGLYRKQKQYDLAEQSYLKIMELEPDSPWAMSNYSSFLSSFRSEHDQAIVYGKKALELMNFDMGHRILAEVYYKKGSDLLLNKNQPDASMEYFKLALEHYPDYANAYYGLGMAYSIKGMHSRDASLLEKAEGQLISAIRFDPDHEQAREQLMKLEEYSADLLGRKNTSGPITSSTRNEGKIMAALKDLADAQKIHKNKYGAYALHPELLAGLGKVGRDTGLSIGPKLTFEGYYFTGLKKQSPGNIDLNKSFVLVAIPSNYSPGSQYTYAIGPAALILRKDVGVTPVTDASQIDNSWKQVK